MALPVLDGNQTATTLSSVVTGGEHIVAHSVVSLGANAIANITSAVSGVAISGEVTANDPSLITRSAIVADTGKFIRPVAGRVSGGGISSSYEPIKVDENGVVAISGTVTANIPLLPIVQSGGDLNAYNIQIAGADINGNAWPIPVSLEGLNVPISGTVTANAVLENNFLASSGIASDDGGAIPSYAVQIGFDTEGSGLATVKNSSPFPISGTVTANVIGLNYSDGLNPVQLPIRNDLDDLPYVVVGASASQQNSFPISGTVTVGNVAGFNIPTHDFKSFDYTGSNLTQIAYKTGGASGTTVGILTLAYDGNGNLTSMTKS